MINDGTELFGDQRGAANGYEELVKLDENQDGKIDAKDKAFDALTLLSEPLIRRTIRFSWFR